MDALLFVNYVNNINGTVIDILDYFFTIYENNKNFKLLIVNYNSEFKSDLNHLIYDRYIIDDLDFQNNIIGIEKRDLLKIKFDRLLIFDFG